MQTSSFWVRSGSYLRLKTMQLGYNLPKSVLDLLKIRTARVYVSGQNLLTFTKFPDGYDPEANTTAFHGHILGGAAGWSYPQAKSFTVGLDVNF